MAEVGLAAAIIAFVEVSTKVLARIREFRSTAEEVPVFLQDITVQLPLIVDVMKEIEKGYKEGSLTADALSPVVEGCRRKINMLDSLIEKIVLSSTDSTWQRTRKAIASIRREKDFEKIQKTLESYKTTLTLHLSQRSAASIPDAAKKSTYYELPSSRVSRFVQRVKLMEDIEASFANATANPSHPKIVVLVGMGGQGKTQLALEYASVSRSSGKYQAIFWIDASSSNTVSRGFETIATKISSPVQVFKDVESKIKFVKETLGKWEIPWLMVFDNYDQPSEFRNITDYIPQGRTGAILFTSRHGDSERLGTTIRLTKMTEDEGLELLLRQSNLEKSDDNVVQGTKIIQKLGLLPLAIDQTGAYIRARKLPLQLFASHYDHRKEVVLKHTPAIWEYRRNVSEGKSETSLSVFTTWELSFQQIGKNEEDRTRIGHFLTLSAFLDTSSIGESLFRLYVASSNDPPEWMKDFMSSSVWDQYQYQDILVELQSLSLLQTMDIGNAESRFSLHPLVADWLKLRIDQGARQKYIIEAMIILKHYLDTQDKDTLPLQTKLDVLSHIDICLQNDKEYLQKLDESDELSIRESAYTFALFYHGHSRYKEAEAMYQRALKLREKALGPDHISTLQTVNNLGRLYKDQGRLAEAEAMHKRALMESEKALGPDHISALDIVNNLGILYQTQRKLAEAEAMHQRALKRREKALGPDHITTLSTVNSLGILYQDQGKLAEAEAMYQRALMGWEKALGPDHISTLSTVNNLGILYKDQGKQVEAEAMFQRALTGYEQALGPGHISTLNAVHNLAHLYSLEGKQKEAETLYQRALIGYEKALGPNHMYTLNTVNNLGKLYLHQRKLTEAGALLQRAHVGYEKALGSDHVCTLNAANNLGALYMKQGKLAEAEAMYQQALFGYEKALEPDHQVTLDTVYNLGLLYADQGKLAEAEPLYQRALAAYKKTLGQDHQSTLRTMVKEQPRRNRGKR